MQAGSSCLESPDPPLSKMNRMRSVTLVGSVSFCGGLRHAFVILYLKRESARCMVAWVLPTRSRTFCSCSVVSLPMPKSSLFFENLGPASSSEPPDTDILVIFFPSVSAPYLFPDLLSYCFFCFFSYHFSQPESQNKFSVCSLIRKRVFLFACFPLLPQFTLSWLILYLTFL